MAGTVVEPVAPPITATLAVETLRAGTGAGMAAPLFTWPGISCHCTPSGPRLTRAGSIPSRLANWSMADGDGASSDGPPNAAEASVVTDVAADPLVESTGQRVTKSPPGPRRHTGMSVMLFAILNAFPPPSWAIVCNAILTSN